MADKATESSVVGRAARRGAGIACVLVLASTIFLRTPAPAASPDSTFFRIGGTKVEDAAFRWSAAIAGVASRPPGLPACDVGGTCGIPGVIAVAQTFESPQALIRAVAAGTVESGIASANMVQASRCDSKGGDGKSAQQDLRVLANLYREQLHLVARRDAKIASPADLAGKTVIVGEKDSAAELAARALFDAAGVAKKIKFQNATWPAAIEALEANKVPAAIFLGPVPDPRLVDAAQAGDLMLVPITGGTAQKLVKAGTVFAPEQISADAYPGLGAASTIAQFVQWVVRDKLDPGLAYKLTQAAWAPANRKRIVDMVQPIVAGELGTAWTEVPAPVDEGAKRYYTEKGVPGSELACPSEPVTPSAPPAPATPAAATNRPHVRS
ncbi:TAXI family TRAP transporter solute-binding subunit [Roseiterribacter gracilis]|uniref:C4-dicarboxylate ABC transporter substrate-binding protein n=1 Tax=Roseiterribacter gracilis TaxID=2812848 RepID=A0A8S8XGL0_9PROT|nr:C4-dicarboxylate ABC transporter substrate-binding protein [Rhodospirillales bacterium TMPK1]